MLEARFEIGTQFKSPGKYGAINTVTDIFKTYNSKNELVSIRYQSQHELMGQVVTNNEVADSTIFRNLIKQPLKVS
jgi:hypothetical protein